MDVSVSQKTRPLGITELYGGSMGVLLDYRDYRGSIGINYGLYWGLYWDNGKENGNYGVPPEALFRGC